MYDERFDGEVGVLGNVIGGGDGRVGEGEKGEVFGVIRG